MTYTRWTPGMLEHARGLKANGLTNRAIALVVGARSHQAVANKLCEDAEARRDYAAVVRSKTRKPQPRPGQQAMRGCLRCGKPFMSDHIGNRLCRKCGSRT